MPSTVAERFLRYVRFDTQSDAASSTQPSTAKQLALGRLLVEELREIGLADAHLDEHGYVYATVPSTSPKPDVPVICFCAHMDTAPDFSGLNVRPRVVENYRGGDIALGASGRTIRAAEHAVLNTLIGHDIVTTDGTTLLGADDKAGLAEIVSAAAFLVAHPEIPHGAIRLLFTPDEEIGRGVDKVDLAKLGAQAGYTMDGSTAGRIEDESFSADGVQIAITGVAIHPGFAFGRMENAIKIASAIVTALPEGMAPETTHGREGFLHPTDLTATMEGARLHLIVRDFTEEGLAEKEAQLSAIVEGVLSRYPGSTHTLAVTPQYRNMKSVLDRVPEVVGHAVEAVRHAGLTPRQGSIRGGTDGSRLSFMGLPTANIFAGGHAFHSPLEFVSVQDMEAAVRVIVELAKLWEERA